MAAVLMSLVLLLAITGHSSGLYCVCKDGLSDSVLQKNIDYACGSGADCTQILQNGACYNPNTVKDHCNYAVNSYFQKKGQTNGSCDFSGTATTTSSLSSTNSACVYPSSASSSTTPSTGPSTTTPTTGTSSTTPSGVFGISPSGGITSTDSSGSALQPQSIQLLFWSVTILLFLSGPTLSRI
ncbi:hypothetical protein NMG60_11009329 [Bertholletia excelsa]